MFRTLLFVALTMSIASVSLAQSAAPKIDKKTQTEARRVHRWLQEHPDIAERIIRSVQQRRNPTEDRDKSTRERRRVRSHGRSKSAKSDDRDKSKSRSSSSDDKREQMRKRIEAWRQGTTKRMKDARKDKEGSYRGRSRTPSKSTRSHWGHSSHGRSKSAKSDYRDKSKSRSSSSDDRREQMRKRIEAWRQGMAKRMEDARKDKDKDKEESTKRSRGESYRGRRSTDERRQQWRRHRR